MDHKSNNNEQTKKKNMPLHPVRKVTFTKKNIMVCNIDSNWKLILNSEWQQPYFEQLSNFIETEYDTMSVFPPKDLIFNAFNTCPFDQIKVVILGQDPYHGENQAHGLCFSVNEGVKIPPSLRNIFKELATDIGITPPTTGNLLHWSKQGVLLLNATLTVRKGEAGSHQKKGWEIFTDAVIKKISDEHQNVVFLLWGAYAIKKGALIDADRNHILTAVHPSPLSASRGFFGCKHFSKTNAFLQKKGLEQINW